MTDESLHWADQTATRILEKHPDKKQIVCAAGITPSGVIHIGNFREIITVELIVRALRRQLTGTDRTVRFIYSWDDYDVFRKVPKNMPKQDELKQHLRKPIVDVPDPFEKEESYARYHEVQIEKEMPAIGIQPEYLYQAKKYRACEYAEEMKQALEKKDAIKKILDKFRKEPLPSSFLPVSIFCEKCNSDTITTIEYPGEYELTYECSCGHKDTFDFRKKGIAKLPWRVDWPMRWKREQVDFEPGGKEHSSSGGSFDTAKHIVKAVYGYEAPLYIMYDYVRIKGGTGKISSSVGDVITIKEMKEIYEPAMIRWLFTGARVGSEFAISFDADVIKLYEDFDKCERMYYNKEKAKNDKEKMHQQRVYELAVVDDIPKEMSYQPSFRHLTTVVQLFEHDIEKVVIYYQKEGVTKQSDIDRIILRANCASNWLQKYAPEEFTFTVNETSSQKISNTIVPAIKKFMQLLKELEDPDEIGSQIYHYCKDNNINPKDFFQNKL